MATRDLTLNIGARTKDLNAALGKMRKDVRSATGNVTALMKQAGTQMTVALTAPLAMFGRASIKTFASFEQSMAKVKAVSGATSYQFEQLTNTAKHLGATTRFTASEVSGLMLEFSKLGFTSSEIQKVTKATLELAQATDSDLSQSAAVAGQVLRAFGLDASETQRVVDVMAKSFSSSALDMTTFQDSMSYVAPIAKAAGLSIEETTAMLGTLHNAGIRGSKAGTALRRIFTEMIDTGLPAGQAIAKLAKEGLDLGGAMDEVGKRAMSALLVLTENKKSTDELTEALKNAKGSAADMAAIMDNTTEGAFKRMSSALEAVAISFGQSFAPVANKIADTIASVAQAFSSLPGPVRNVLGVLGLLTAAAGPLLLLAPQLLAARVALTTFKAAVLQTKLAMAVLNPMFPLLLASAAALGTGYLLLNARTIKAKKVHDRLTKSMNKARQAYKGLSDEMKGKAANMSTEDLKKRLAQLDAQVAENNNTVKEANKGADIYARLNGEQADQINMVRGEIQRNTGASVELRQATAANAKIEQERQIILSELQDRLDAVADSTEDVAEANEKLTFKTDDPYSEAMDSLAERELESFAAFDIDGDDAKHAQTLADVYMDMAKVASKFYDMDAAGLFKEMAREQQKVADSFGEVGPTLEDYNEWLEKTEQQAKQFAEQVKGFGMSLAGSIGNVFSNLISGTKSFGQMMGDILKQLLVKLASMVAAFAIISVLFPGSAGSLGGFLKAGFGIPQATPMAEGGIVSGPSHILAGEYAGARSNPEVIAPLSKLKSMMGGGSLSARVSGRDLLFISQRDSRNARRQYTSTLI